MKDIKLFIWMVGLGVGLTAFAFSNFATKDSVSRIEKKLDKVIYHLMGKK